MLSTAQQSFVDPKSAISNSNSKNRVLTRLRSAFSTSLEPAVVAQAQPLSEVSSSQNTSLDDLELLDQIISDVETEKNNNSTKPDFVTPVKDLTQVETVLSNSDVNLDSLAVAVPTATLTTTDTLNPASSRGTAKEKLISSNPVETNSSASSAEIVPNREVEMPVEVESYMQEVVNSQDQLPAEIVIADDGADISLKQYPSQPVVVLPITQAVEKEGEKKSPTFSVRWLVEFSRKLMKIFSGSVIYKEEE